MTTIQIRIDEKTKRSAQKVLGKLGIDMSTAIKAYLKQISIRDGIPFSLYTKNGLTVAEEQEILRREQEAKQGKNVAGPFTSTKSLLKELHRP